MAGVGQEGGGEVGGTLFYRQWGAEPRKGFEQGRELESHPIFRRITLAMVLWPWIGRGGVGGGGGGWTGGDSVILEPPALGAQSGWGKNAWGSLWLGDRVAGHF